MKLKAKATLPVLFCIFLGLTFTNFARAGSAIGYNLSAGGSTTVTPIEATMENPSEKISISISDADSGRAGSVAFADYGILQSGAIAYGSRDFRANFSANTYAFFDDGITVDAADRDGEEGYLYGSIYYDRRIESLGSPLSGSVGVKLTINTNSATGSLIEFSSIDFSCGNPGGCPSTFEQIIGGNGIEITIMPTQPYLQVAIPIVFGQEFGLSLLLETSAFAPASVSNSVWDADAANSLYWDGIARVTDRQGNDLEYSISSLSGTDYRTSLVPTAPIPEPQTYALMLAGLAAMGAAARRRKAA